jgi:hypothetical protein
MIRKFIVGATVHYEGAVLAGVGRGIYKVMRQSPVERDHRVVSRIKCGRELRAYCRGALVEPRGLRVRLGQ